MTQKGFIVRKFINNSLFPIRWKPHNNTPDKWNKFLKREGGGGKKKIKLSFFAGPHFSPHLITYVKIRLSYFGQHRHSYCFLIDCVLAHINPSLRNKQEPISEKCKTFLCPLNKCHILEEGMQGISFRSFYSEIELSPPPYSEGCHTIKEICFPFSHGLPT